MNAPENSAPISRTRKTKETDISMHLTCNIGTLQGKDKNLDIVTPVPFFSHMLSSMLFHGSFSGTVHAQGDVDVDAHHLVEDVGIILGDILAEYAFSTQPICRFGHAVTPMDDALAECAVDMCNRAFLHYDARFPQAYAGAFDVALAREFFTALAHNAHMNLHLVVRYGLNSHHMLEALFKSCGRALRMALQSAHGDIVQSTKGVL